MEIKNIKKYILGLVSGLVIVGTITYAADSGSIGALFNYITSGSENGVSLRDIWRLDGKNIQDGSITSYELANYSITNSKILNASITTDKLSNNSITKDKLNLVSGNVGIGTNNAGTKLSIIGDTSNSSQWALSVAGSDKVSKFAVRNDGYVYISGDTYVKTPIDNDDIANKAYVDSKSSKIAENLKILSDNGVKVDLNYRNLGEDYWYFSGESLAKNLNNTCDDLVKSMSNPCLTNKSGVIDLGVAYIGCSSSCCNIGKPAGRATRITTRHYYYVCKKAGNLGFSE